MSLEKSTRPQCAEHHFDHIAGIINTASLLKGDAMETGWNHITFALLGAEHHAEALFGMVQDLEAENYRLKEKVKDLNEAAAIPKQSNRWSIPNFVKKYEKLKGYDKLSDTQKVILQVAAKQLDGYWQEIISE